jgi:3-oxoacyl-[acyl-carrier-protein] synthase III
MAQIQQSATIVGLGSFLPGNPIENRDLARVFQVNEEWIDHFIGNKTRYFAIDINSGQVLYTLAEICTKAAQQAIENSGYSVEEIEFIVMATATPDHLMPATVNLVAEKLGLNLLPTYQLQSGCAGAIQALDVARQFLLSGSYTKGLVIGGDVCAKYIDLNQDFSNFSSSELVNYVLFGDGAGAAIMTTDVHPSGLVLERILNQVTGIHQAPGQTINWFGSSKVNTEGLQAIKEDYKAIEKRVPEMSREILEYLIDEMQWDLDSIDFILPPQLSGNMTQHIIEFLSLPQEKMINCVADTGNNGNALPFLQLQRLDSLMQSGQRALGITVESSKWIKGGLALSKI